MLDQVSVSGSGISTMGEETPVSEPSMMQHISPSVELDFDLMWPDAEDLFETLLATEATNKWQMPLTTLPMSSRPIYPSSNMFEQPSPGTFGDSGSLISPIPSGESHRAVHNVSEMVSSLVSSTCQRSGNYADAANSHQVSRQLWKQPLSHRFSWMSVYICSSCASYQRFLYFIEPRLYFESVDNHCY